MAKQSERDRVNETVLADLAGVREDHPVYRAVHALLDYQINIADQQTLAQDLSDSDRARKAGIEWGLKMLKSSLAVMQAQANKDNPPPKASGG